MFKRLDKWHETRAGLISFGIIKLALAYGFASLAINNGSFWCYALAIILLVRGLQDIVKLIRDLIHGDKRKTSKA